MDNAKIKLLIEDLLKKIDVSFDSVDIVNDSFTGGVIFIIKTKESGLLIGERGETFQSLSHLIKKMVNKGREDLPSQFAIDVNDYQSSMIEKIRSKANILANRARDLKSDVEMEPMSSYERLIVHGALTDQSNIKTESVGEGKDRRVVIKYIKQEKI